MKAITTLSAKQKRAIASTRAVAMGNGTPAQVAEARALLGAMAREPWYRDDLKLDRHMGIADVYEGGARNEGDTLILSARGASAAPNVSATLPRSSRGPASSPNVPSRLSPYADQLDRAMGFAAAGGGIRNEGDQLILGALGA